MSIKFLVLGGGYFGFGGGGGGSADFIFMGAGIFLNLSALILNRHLPMIPMVESLTLKKKQQRIQDKFWPCPLSSLFSALTDFVYVCVCMFSSACVCMYVYVPSDTKLLRIFRNF